MVGHMLNTMHSKVSTFIERNQYSSLLVLNFEYVHEIFLSGILPNSIIYIVFYKVELIFEGVKFLEQIQYL